MAGLLIKNLCKTFNADGSELKVLNNIDLEIGDKSFVTIIGKSGCGKTTLLRILCGLEQKTAGSVEFINCEDGKKKISIVFQEPRLMPWLTVEENVAFSIKNSKKDESLKNVVDSNLKLLGLYKFRKAYPSQISGGMAQRVSLGRTLCYDPDIILMDEPLGALDAFTRRKLQNELIKIFTKMNKTILFVTHDIEEALYLGQKIVIMNNGLKVKELPIDMKYVRDVNSVEFLKYKSKILNHCSNIWGDKNEMV
ncbi:MAG: ABC transporter ATP-binding protein [Clostridium sp.]|nr:ABC transporter ATP-binding protein [Clostridium sp.]